MRTIHQYSLINVWGAVKHIAVISIEVYLTMSFEKYSSILLWSTWCKRVEVLLQTVGLIGLQWLRLIVSREKNHRPSAAETADELWSDFRCCLCCPGRRWHVHKGHALYWNSANKIITIALCACYLRPLCFQIYISICQTGRNVMLIQQKSLQMFEPTGFWMQLPNKVCLFW